MPADHPLAAWFLGPKAEHGDIWQATLSYIFQDYLHWRRNYFPTDPVIISRSRRRLHEQWLDRLNANIDTLLNSLKAHYPFYSPRYLAHMLSEQTLPSVVGYFAGMLYNPNNVTDEAAPVTVQLEIEVGRMISAMLGYNPRTSWAHICSGGTLANLEALWAARTSQFAPFIARSFCQEHHYAFQIKLPSGRREHLAGLGDAQLLALRPNEAMFIFRKLARYLIGDLHQDRDTALRELNSFSEACEYNVSRQGLARVLSRIGLKPVLLVSAAAHYSIRKAANVLGYGDHAVRFVPVNAHFRMDIAELQREILQLGEDEYLAAVIAIVGTTEEGAVDPVHEILFLRDRLATEQDKSFWLHVDAAWGGYIRSLFSGVETPRRQRGGKLDDLCGEYIKAIDAREEFEIGFRSMRMKRTIEWSDKEVVRAFLAVPDAESVTVDPHKMGYVPYPAGVVAFRNGLVTELITQRAQYISDVHEGLSSIDELGAIDAVGPYILEGSKPGAAAAACWLAHTTIPLTIHSHGKIIKTTLLNARKLVRYLQAHRRAFFDIDEMAVQRGAFSDPARHAFTFVPLFEPDTNVVCFVAVEMGLQSKKLVPIDMDLERMNEFNKSIYSALSLGHAKHGPDLPYGQPFFVSRTTLTRSQYSALSIAKVLDLVGVAAEEYRKHGLFVLRSVVMNPLLYVAEQEGVHYLLEFVIFLHQCARAALSKILQRDAL
jgi:glutamate/tyrosine decarboxylase-like PLP-dependent enzyme